MPNKQDACTDPRCQAGHPSSPFRPTVAKKVGLAFFILVLTGAAVDRIYHLHKQDAGALSEAVNIAGSQRMLSQRIAYLVTREARQGTAPGSELDPLFARFEAGLTALRGVQQQTAGTKARAAMRAALQELRTTWARYKSAAQKLQRLSPGSRAAVKALDYVHAHNDSVLTAAETLVQRTIDANVDGALRLDLWFRGTEAAGLFVVVVVFGLVRRNIVRPLQKLARSALRFSNGELSVRTEHYSRDEVGDLVRVLNCTADQTQDLITRLEHEHRVAQHNSATLNSVLESAANGIMITDAQKSGNPLVYVNPAFEQITGYASAECLGESLAFLHGHNPDQPGLVEIRAALDQGREGHALLQNARKDGSLFWNELHVAPVRDESGTVSHHVGIINDITDRKHYEEQLERQSNYDMLTGLPNRNLLNDRLQQAIHHAHRHDRILAVLFLDLDNFKFLNDTLGHSGGDALLRQIGYRCRDCLRLDDTVARHSGDEFAVVLEDVSNRDDIASTAQQVLECIAGPITALGKEFTITATIGVSVYPDHGSDPETLLMNADTALHHAKTQGKNHYQIYTPQMSARSAERLSLERDLRLALDRQEFELHYQPKVDMRTGRVTAFEALLRWNHPQQGTIPPCDFIPISEETGLIVPIGQWVLRSACLQAKRWQAVSGWPVAVAVNVSARQFSRHDFPSQLATVVAETEMDPKCLHLEITESLLMQNVDATAAMLRRLKDMGVSIAVDDFGTGYSALSYLQRFPIDKLKIDRSFVREITSNPGDAAIALSVLTLAHTLDLTVVAEGVETEGQLAYLRRHGCDEVQGFYFSKPLDADSATQMLRETSLFQPPELEGAERVLLIVDDEQNVISALTRLLRQDGYRILTARSADEGFELLARHKVDVVLSDQRMPGTTGTQFLSAVKGLYPDTVRIVLSGYAELDSVVDAINSGSIYKFFAKPWDDKALREAIWEAFRHREISQENVRLSEELQTLKRDIHRPRSP